MFKYILKRLAFAVAALFIITAVIFSLLRLMPVEGYFPNFDKMSPEMIQKTWALTTRCPSSSSASTGTSSTGTWAPPGSTSPRCPSPRS